MANHRCCKPSNKSSRDEDGCACPTGCNICQEKIKKKPLRDTKDKEKASIHPAKSSKAVVNTSTPTFVDPGDLVRKDPINTTLDHTLRAGDWVWKRNSVRSFTLLHC